MADSDFEKNTSDSDGLGIDYIDFPDATTIMDPPPDVRQDLKHVRGPYSKPVG